MALRERRGAQMGSKLSASDIESQFTAALKEAGLATRDGMVVPADSKLHRFAVHDDKPGRRSGWAILHADGWPHGVAGDWRTGDRITWMRRGRPITLTERKAAAVARRRREAERTRTIKKVAHKAAALWARLPPAPADHEYLRKKKADAGPCRVTRTGSLVVPVFDGVNGDIMSLQFIRSDGTKRFLTGGRTARGCCTLGDLEGRDPIVVAEGYATAASIREATGWPVVVAFTAGNLRAVADGIRQRYPKRDLVIAADNDSRTVGNPGVRYATEAARAARARLAIPTIPGDYNDLFVSQGADVVCAVLEEAVHVDPGSDGNMTPAIEAPPGFEMQSSGLYWVHLDDPERPPLHLSGPFEILAETRDDDGNAWGILLRWKDDDGRPHTWAMPRSLLAGNGSDVRRILLDGGLYVAPSRGARDKLTAYLASARVASRARAVTRTGWHRTSFVLPDVTLGDTGEEKVLLQTAGVLEHAYRIRGSLGDWQDHVARYANGNSRLVLAISTAFAAPLLSVCGAESGGFHLRGPSSTGKTTGLLVAGSVWGGGDMTGYIESWRATSNGLEGVAAAHCDTLLCLDELSQISAREAGEVAYMLANGTGRSRATRDGSARRPARWRILFLSTGEVGLADKIAEDGRGRRASAGQQVRIVDVPSDAGAGMGLFEHIHGFASPDAFARHLRAAATSFYGSAGRALVEAVSCDAERVRTEVMDLVAGFSEEHVPAGADGQVIRVARRFGLVAAAGELATRLGVLPWQEGEARDGLARCFRDWLEGRGGVDPAEIGDAIAQIRHFFELHGESRFTPLPINGDARLPTVNRAGFRRVTEKGETLWLVFPEVMSNELCVGFDRRIVVQALLRKGFLLPDADGKPQLRHRVPGLGVRRFYCITSAVLGDDNA